MDKPNPHARELRLIMEATKTNQSRLSRLLGTNYVTVNRWVSERADSLVTPFYALAFMRAYLMLNEAQRETLVSQAKASAS